MLASLALIVLFGLLLGLLFKKLTLPSLLGMLLAGIALGPLGLNALDPALLSIAPDLRHIALIIILMRAGLALDFSDLKKVGRPAVLMCFVPACFEIVGVALVAPPLLGVTFLEAAVMGAVLAAVSPAVVVPKMLNLMERGYGANKSVPQLIMAGASVDDVFVIVVFTAFLGLLQGDSISPLSLFRIPVSIALGFGVGVVVGIALMACFKRVHMRDSAKVIILLSVSFIFVALEGRLKAFVPFSGLLAVMSMGGAIKKRGAVVALRLSGKFSKLWVAAEVALFALVGATLDVHYALKAGAMAIAVILISLLFRMAGVFVSLLKTNLTMKERLFCMIAYCPKATVQAAIGPLPLAMGLASGSIILTVAVLAILITAPLGAFGIDMTHRKLLSRDPLPTEHTEEREPL